MKLILTVQNGTLTGKTLEISDGFLTVGRGANCNLIFNPTAENMVSTKHAYIEAKSDGFYLIDDKSTNGTFVNGNRIQVIKLNSNDIIQFGKNGPEARIFVENSVENQSPNNQATLVLNQQNSQATVIRQNEPPLSYQPAQTYNSTPTQELNPQQMQPTQMGNWQQFQPQVTDAYSNQASGVRNSFSYMGLSKPEIAITPASNQTGKYIGAAIAILVFVFLGLIAMLLIGSTVGPVAAVIASFVAFTPAVIYILPLMFLDRYDPEPPWLIACAFAWGAIVAIVFSFIVNTTIGEVVGLTTQSREASSLVTAVISAPIFEEGSKGLGVVLLLVFFRREFDDILDGIVYGGVIGLGFATVENVLYYGRGVNAGVGMLGYLLFVRGLLSPFIHSTFTSMTGIGCGISRESHNKLIRIIAPILGYIGAVTLHFMWNGVISTLSFILLGRNGFWIFYAILAIPFFLLFIGFCVYIMRRQNKILHEMLAIDVARGLISDEQMNTVTSVFKSTAWLANGLFSGKFMARNRFLRAVGKLGLSYWHIQRATAAQGQTGSFQQNPILREEVLRWRDQI